MIVLNLAWRSLLNRKLTTALTAVSIAFSVGLLVGVENVRSGVRESFANTISRTDLIVGARGGVIQLLLYSVFGMGSPTNNIRYRTFEKIAEHPAVKWAVPYSLGDSHRGFRVIGTTSAFFEHYRYRGDGRVEFEEGRAPRNVFDVALGNQVASGLSYRIGDRIEVSHGLREGFLNHDDKPFRVVGIIKRTSTPIDRALYITLEGMQAVHADWKDGAPPLPGKSVPAHVLLQREIRPEQITAFFLGATSRIDTLRLQREINDYEDEPLTAIIPGVALSELWQGIGYAEDGLQVVSLFVVIVGLLGMLVSLYTSLNERRREMAILRALGSGPSRIVSLLTLESGFLATAGAVSGLVLAYASIALSGPFIEDHFGLYFPLQAPSSTEWLYVAAVVTAGFLIGLAPAYKAYKNSLSDGLTIRI